MLQFLVCSDIHSYAENIRLAIRKTDQVDAILIAGDLEVEEDKVRAIVGSIPCFMVCGNNDYYLNTDYPQELLIDICENTGDTPVSSNSSNTSNSTNASNESNESNSANSSNASNESKGLWIGNVTALTYDSVPDTDSAKTSPGEGFLASILSRLFAPKADELPIGLSFPQHTFKRPSNIRHRILMTHGKEYNVPDVSLLARRAGIWDADLVIFGHTHQFLDTTFQRGKIRLINPGCLVGDPKATIRAYGNYEICSYSLLRILDNGGIEAEHLFL